MGPARRKLLVVGTTGDYAPFSKQTATGFEGLDITLAEALCAKLERTLTLEQWSWTVFREALAGGHVDMLMSGITVTPAREEQGLFSRPYLYNRTVLLGRKDEPANAASGTRRLGVNHGGYLETVARARFPDWTICTTRHNAALAADLTAGQYDAVLSDALEARAFVAEAPVRVIAELEAQQHAIFFPKNRAELRDEVDQALHELGLDGSLKALAARHGIDTGFLPKNLLGELPASAH